MSDPTAILSTLPLNSHLLSYLSHLHKKSLLQESGMDPSATSAIKEKYQSDPAGAVRELDDLMRDKFIALDPDKCVFIYNSILASGAETVVEIGTSFGVSTVYLALAGNEVARRHGRVGKVIATEKEASKCAIARGTWKNADPEDTLGLAKIIELKQGDLEVTLKEDIGDRPVDFVLLDIWPYVALPALKLLLPRLRPGSVIITDNVVMSAGGYKDLLSVLRDPKGDFRTITLPYNGGLEMSVYWPK